ncbi:MAG: DUF2799 domain-containing protein [Halobacteriovoraceae bacterium]|nr:DUF2799 domain-containing protein [Halobacteriovoraceae bacterium]MBT5093265.1 DUF2799 domain-containing protein [Halobacteriovoraceae bacterium]
MKIYNLFLFILATIFGCASLTEEQCKKGDWHALGLLDGKKGRRSVQVDQHIRACQKYQISLDEKIYNDGRLKGLSQYCTKENGYKVGFSGKRYTNVCRGTSEKVFLKMYHLGKKTHLVNQELKENQRDLKVKRQDLGKISGNNSDSAELKSDIKQLEQEEELLKNKLIFLRGQAPYRPEDIVDLF